MGSFLEIAKPLLKDGFSIIPIEPNGKRPIPGIGAKSRLKLQTSDDVQILDLWAKNYPEANVAIVADENIVILESDDYTALQNALIAGTGKSFPQTRAACGSSANRPHFFFKRTEKATNVGNLAVPGIFEARFSNQYVVAPGSTHPSGAVYRWLNDLPVIEIPDWLVSELARLALSQKSGESAPRNIQITNGRVPEGSRHYFLMSELGRLWNGKLTEEEMIEKGRELNALCDPPKDEEHVLECVRDIMRRDPNTPGPTVLIGGKAPEPKEQKVGNPDFRFPKVTGKIQDYVLKPKEGQNPFSGWFPRGRVSLIGGSSGVGKTTLVVDLLNKQRGGDPYLGHPGAALDFLVLFADRTTLSNVETLTRMGLDRSQIPIAYMPVCWDNAAANQILTHIEDNQIPPAVFIEGADALVSDANKTQVVAPFLTAMQKIAEWYHIALVLSVGAPKQKPKEGYKLTRDQIFGSQIWGRMAEDVLILAFDGEEEGRVLTVAHRNAKKESYHLEFGQSGLLVERAPLAVLAGVKETKAQLKSGKFLELQAFLESQGEGTIVPSLSELQYYGSKNTVAEYLKELSNPLNPWVRKEDNRWVVARKQTKGE